MKLHTRMSKLARWLTDHPATGQLSLIVCRQVDQDHAKYSRPGVYYNVDGTVATLVHEGDQPDPISLDALKTQLAPDGLAIILDPRVVPVPSVLP